MKREDKISRAKGPKTEDVICPYCYNIGVTRVSEKLMGEETEDGTYYPPSKGVVFTHDCDELRAKRLFNGWTYTYNRD